MEGECLIMSEMAIFTEEVAMALLARGFKLKGYSDQAWFFEDSVLLERTVSKLVESLQEVDRQNRFRGIDK